jgi:hypothetical protein
MPRKAQLVLPTIETCRWRESLDGAASCGLVSSMIGNGRCPVTVDACAACCASFPPSPRQLNPVVASLLFDSACKILERDESDTEAHSNARGMKQLAERFLAIVHEPHLRVTPARTRGDCCWLREPLPAGNGSLSSDAEALFSCAHPNYQRTTPSQCRMCRDWTKHPPISRFLSLEELVPLPGSRSGPAVKRWAVGVTTSPRRVPTLETCLDSIVRAGWEQPRLFLDGTMHVPLRYSHLPVTWREDSIGALPSWYMALAELILQQPDADAYVVLQDDVVLFDRESLREHLERVLWPGDHPGLVSLFYTGLDSANGWFEAKGAWHFSAQGFIFPPGAARAFLSDADVSRSWLAASFETHIPIPEVLFEWTAHRKIDVWYTNPSLAQHIGGASTIWMDAGIAGGRRAPWFSGSVETEFVAEESLDDFPEDAFPCDDELRDEYEDRVDRGRSRMRELSVVLCGLCRDVRLHLPRTAARMERLGSMFDRYRVVFFENDSIDATREFLFDWQLQNPRVDILSETAGAPTFPRSRSLERAHWLARCRNRCRERVVEQFSDYDYVIVIDTDLPGGWSYNGVSHSFGGDEWDFVGSYGLQRRLDRNAGGPRYVHFDIWAFHPARGTAARKLIDHSKLSLRRGEPLLPVESCFGGLGLYRMACMKAVEYGGADCEHVIFHQRLRQAGFGKLYLNPSQIVLYTPV